MKHKLLTAILVFSLTFCLVACGSSAKPTVEDSVFYNFNKAVVEEEFIQLLGEPDEIIENYNDNSSLKRYYYYDVDFSGVKGKLALEFYRTNYIFTLRQAIFTVVGEEYEDKKQYSEDLNHLTQFFDAVYECRSGTDPIMWYNNFKDETVQLAQSNTGFGFIYKHVD